MGRVALCLLALLAACDDDGPTVDAATACDAGFDPARGGLDRCSDQCLRPGSGYVCAVGTGMDRCPDDDGANDCDCYSATSGFVCTLVRPSRDDAGMLIAPPGRPFDAPAWPYCRDDADCAGRRCVFDPDPREALGRCR